MTRNELTQADAEEIEIEIGGETFKSGTSRGRRLVATAASGSESDQHWIDVAERVIDKLRTGAGIKHKLDDEGDRLTLGELLERNDLAVADVLREQKLADVDPTDFQVGDIVELTTLHNGDPKTAKRGVIREIDEGDDHNDATAKVDYGNSYDYLKNDQNGVLRAGRWAMGVGFSAVYDVETGDPETADDDLQAMRADALESAELDEAAAELDVEVERTWTTSGGESNRETDEHARVTVSGDALEDPVVVECTNIFEAGWGANVDADLDDDTEALVIRAARNNSPIATGTRL